MNKKRALSLFCIITLAATVLAINKSFGKQTQNGANESTQQQVKSVPEHVSYMVFFRSLAFLKRKADEFDKQGKPNTLRTLIQREAGLNDAQMQAIEQVAADCAQERAQHEAKVKAANESFRECLQSNPPPDGYLPIAPPELKALQAERETIYLHARDRIRAALGEQDFARFDAFVKQKTKAKATPAAPQQPTHPTP